MNDNQKGKEKVIYIDSINLAHFSPSINDIVQFVNDVMKNIKTPAGNRSERYKNSFKGVIREESDPLKASNFPDKCPYCKTEGSLELNNAPWEYNGEFLDIPGICGNCGKRSKIFYHIEFEQTEGRD